MRYIIYCHTSPSGKRYVGQTKVSVKYRLACHKHGRGLFGRAVRKYGASAMRMSTREGANRAEQLWAKRQ